MMGDSINGDTVIDLVQNAKKRKKNLHRLARLGNQNKIKEYLDDFGIEDISKLSISSVMHQNIFKENISLKIYTKI